MSAAPRGPTVVRDPGITIGPYIVRERTDGSFVLADDRLPQDGSVARLGKSKDAAVREAERLVGLGSPKVIANPAAPARSGRQELAGDGGDQNAPRRRA